MPFHSEHYERHAIFSREIVYITIVASGSEMFIFFKILVNEI